MSDQLADRQSEVTPSETGPVGATGNEHVPHRTSETELDTLAHFRGHAQRKGCKYGAQLEHLNGILAAISAMSAIETIIVH